MSTNIKTWYDFVLQQMAAESYLDQSDLFGGNESTTNVLMFGSNNPYNMRLDTKEPITDILPGATRLTATQAADFLRTKGVSIELFFKPPCHVAHALS